MCKMGEKGEKIKTNVILKLQAVQTILNETLSTLKAYDLQRNNEPLSTSSNRMRNGTG